MSTPTYFIQGVEAECPNCHHKRFTGPSPLRPGDTVECATCKAKCIVDHASEGGLRVISAEKADSSKPT